LRKVVKEAQSPIKSQLVISGGDKFVARQEIKHPQVCDKVFVTSFQEEVSGSQLSSSLHSSLMPRTFNYSKLNQARTNLQVQKDFKDLGIEVL
jgi:hypothetical protein